jgi:hypothetical protein
LKDAAGSNLLSVILYGSAATNEFHEGHSDLNILCITRSLGREDLARLHAPAAWWVKKGHPAPLFLTADELNAFRRYFRHRISGHQGSAPASSGRRCDELARYSDGSSPLAS